MNIKNTVVFPVTSVTGSLSYLHTINFSEKCATILKNYSGYALLASAEKFGALNQNVPIILVNCSTKSLIDPVRYNELAESGIYYVKDTLVESLWVIDEVCQERESRLRRCPVTVANAVEYNKCYGFEMNPIIYAFPNVETALGNCDVDKAKSSLDSIFRVCCNVNVHLIFSMNNSEKFEELWSFKADMQKADIVSHNVWSYDE